jgi:hypothetical protein
MKRSALLFVFASLIALPALAQTDRQLPAYEALRTVARVKGQDWLGRLVEMRGVDGDPQPVRWLLTFRDDSARGSVREFAVARQGIVSERAPVRAAGVPSSVMTARSLNLDSTGAFAAANKQATQSKLGFASVNYLLQNRDGVPAWLVQMFDSSGTEVGKVVVSARDGSLISRLRTPAATKSAAESSAASSTSQPASPDNRPVGDRWVEGGGLVGHSKRWGENAWHTTTNTAVRVGDSISAFFIGRPAPQGTPRH